MSRSARRYVALSAAIVLFACLRVVLAVDPFKDLANRLSSPLSGVIADLEPSTLSTDEYPALISVALEQENRDLRQDDGLPPERYQAIAADVVRRDVSGRRKSIWINRGQADGIHVDSGVASRGVLIGRVIAASESWSEVAVFGDPGFKATARVNGDSGVVITRSGSVLFDLVASRELTGAALISDGLDGRTPPGIPIGVLGEVIAGTGDFSTYALRLGINPYLADTVEVLISP